MSTEFTAVLAGIIVVTLLVCIARFALRWAIRLAIFGFIVVSLFAGAFWWWNNRAAPQQGNQSHPPAARRTSPH
jgi:hypothetical protein